MIYNNAKHNRRSIRLKGYDYTRMGWYFITIVVQKRARLFGKIKNGQIQLSTAGEIIKKDWLKLATLRSYVEVDAFSVMPDHFHGILIIN